MFLVVIGLSCLATSGIVAAHARAAKRLSVAIGAETRSSSIRGSVSEPSEQIAESASVLGRLDIPALNLSVPVMSSDESMNLLKGVGHIPGTAMPGGLGNVGLAGHRDTYLRPLKGIKPKMDIRVVDTTGTYHYQVDSTEIVTPDQVRVLDISSRPELTLVTCYPFYFVGNAPKRFIVHAHLLSALPDAVN